MAGTLTRKQFLALLGMGTFSTLTSKNSLAEMLKNTNDEYHFYVGTYTEGASKGICYCSFNEKSGELSIKGVTENIVNPSFITFDWHKQFLYAVSETEKYNGKPGGSVDAFKIDVETGKLNHLNTQPSFGSAPCYLSVDHTNKFVMVANYFGGNVTVYPINSDGSLAERSDFVQYHGKGINPKRQDQPHAHSIVPSPDNRFVLSADLGTDKVMIFRFDDKNGKLNPANQPFVKIKPGSGPRHIRFHPNRKWVYVLTEMGSTIIVFDYDSEKGKMFEKQTVSMLPSRKNEQNTAAELVISSDGKFLYGSNRGDDSIVVYAINPENGNLTMIQHQSSLGKIPRHFNMDPEEKHILVANKESNNIVVFKRDSKTGEITPNDESLEISSPVCIQFI